MIRIPFINGKHSEKAAPLQRILKRTAHDAGCTEMKAAFVMACFLEHVAAEVSMGNEVSLPGFGLFTCVAWHPRRSDLMPYATPRFYASRGFQNECRYSCLPGTKRNETVEKYRKRNALWDNGKKRTQMVFSAMDAFKANIKAQVPGWDETDN